MRLSGADHKSEIIETGLCFEQLGQDHGAHLAAANNADGEGRTVLKRVLALCLVELGMLVLQEVVVYTGDVDALQHQCVAHNLRSYKLLLQLGVLYEIVQLVFSELGHPRLVEERIFHLRVQRLLLLRVV